MQQREAIILGRKLGMHRGGAAFANKGRWKCLFLHSMDDMKRVR